MIRNVLKNTAIAENEYKIGNTTYVVTLHFNDDGESLAELLDRLIEKSAGEQAAA